MKVSRITHFCRLHTVNLGITYTYTNIRDTPRYILFEVIVIVEYKICLSFKYGIISASSKGVQPNDVFF